MNRISSTSPLLTLGTEGQIPVSLDRREELVAELGSREAKTTAGTGGACGGR